jgi:hypothetical protein
MRLCLNRTVNPGRLISGDIRTSGFVSCCVIGLPRQFDDFGNQIVDLMLFLDSPSAKRI